MIVSFESEGSVSAGFVMQQIAAALNRECPLLWSYWAIEDNYCFATSGYQGHTVSINLGDSEVSVFETEDVLYPPDEGALLELHLVVSLSGEGVTAQGLFSSGSWDGHCVVIPLVLEYVDGTWSFELEERGFTDALLRSIEAGCAAFRVRNEEWDAAELLAYELRKEHGIAVGFVNAMRHEFSPELHFEFSRNGMQVTASIQPSADGASHVSMNINNVKQETLHKLLAVLFPKTE